LEVREGLLDIIFDLTPEKIDETVISMNLWIVHVAGIATGIRQNEIKS
jgi:hypothetical protein